MIDCAPMPAAGATLPRSTPRARSQLFGMFDADGGGTLDLGELKMAMTSLQGESRRKAAELKRLTRSMLTEWKMVHEAQAQFFSQEEKARHKAQALKAAVEAKRVEMLTHQGPASGAVEADKANKGGASHIKRKPKRKP
jgi:hypothetical protein